MTRVMFSDFLFLCVFIVLACAITADVLLSFFHRFHAVAAVYRIFTVCGGVQTVWYVNIAPHLFLKTAMEPIISNISTASVFFFFLISAKTLWICGSAASYILTVMLTPCGCSHLEWNCEVISKPLRSVTPVKSIGKPSGPERPSTA